MEDHKIIELFNERNQLALEETAKKYGSYLMKISMNILNIHSDSEECVNDSYHIVWNSIPPYTPVKFRPYIGRIAKNTALNRYDYLTADKRNSRFDSTLSELEDMFSTGEDLLDILSEKELSSTISDFLRGIEEKPRNIFIRRYWYNDSMADIASAFGISISNAKVILHRIRQQLKSKLEDKGYIV